jgi:hypothetical protein
MSVIEASIAAATKSLLENLKDGDPDETIQEFSNQMAGIIKDAILSATITVPAGIPVQVTPATGTGATTAPIVATIQ